MLAHWYLLPLISLSGNVSPTCRSKTQASSRIKTSLQSSSTKESWEILNQLGITWKCLCFITPLWQQWQWNQQYGLFITDRAFLYSTWETSIHTLFDTLPMWMHQTHTHTHCRLHVTPWPASTTLHHQCFLGGEIRICADKHGSHTCRWSMELRDVMNHCGLTSLHIQMHWSTTSTPT